jgi:hypothetical protein
MLSATAARRIPDAEGPRADHRGDEAAVGQSAEVEQCKDEPDLLRNSGTLVFLEASRQLQPGLARLIRRQRST